jgi:hypothetical protein
MSRAHTFQTPHVAPLPALPEETGAEVLFRVTPGEAERILRALEETSSHLAVAPNGSRIAASYRRLAANLRVQGSRTYEPVPRMVGTSGSLS